MTQSDKTLIKAAMACELTEVPRALLDEDLEIKYMAIRARLAKRLTEVPFKSSVSGCRQRHVEGYKYDRIIGFDNNGVIIMVPLSADEGIVQHAILLSDLKDDPELFFYCSSPYAQTSENKVRSIFAPLAGKFGEPYKGPASLAKDMRIELVLNNNESVYLKVAYIQTYYGALHNWYVNSITKSEKWALDNFDAYFKMVMLGGEVTAEDSPSDNMKPESHMFAGTGKEVEVGTDFMDCVAKIAGGK